MSNLREKALRTRALSEMERNATIEDVACTLSYEIEWKGYVNYDGVMTIGGPNHEKDTGVFEEEDVDIAAELLRQDDIREWLEEKLRQESERAFTFTHVKSATGTVYLKPTLYYKVSYMDNVSGWLSETIRLDRAHHYVSMLNYADLELGIHAEITDDNMDVTADEYTTTLKNVDYIPQMSGKEEFILEYLSQPEHWVDATFGKITEERNFIRLPIELGESTIELAFTDPHDMKSRVWELTQAFGYQDPWNLQQEPLQIAPHPLPTDVAYTDNFWHLRPPEKNQNISRWNSLRHRVAQLL